MGCCPSAASAEKDPPAVEPKEMFEVITTATNPTTADKSTSTAESKADPKDDVPDEDESKGTPRPTLKALEAPCDDQAWDIVGT